MKKALRGTQKCLCESRSSPDFTSLAKRAAKLAIDLSVARRRGPIDIVVGSTGLKVFGEGEWKVRKHGPGKHRTWRKLQLAINPATQEIEAELLTENSGHDADQVPELLEQIPGRIRSFRGDGAYDKWKVYGTLAGRDIKPIIPPQRNAKIKQRGNASLSLAARHGHPTDPASGPQRVEKRSRLSSTFAR